MKAEETSKQIRVKTPTKDCCALGCSVVSFTPVSVVPWQLHFHSSLTQTLAVAFANALHLYFKPIAVITMEHQLMMAEWRKIMQEGRLSQKIQHYTLQCHSSLLCAATLSAHSLALAGIYSSHRGLQRLRGRSSQQRASAGWILCHRGATLSMTWGFTGPGHS